MTRFARAKGSKSSNERVAEEATNWSEFKRQIEEKKLDSSKSNVESVAQSALKRIKQGKQGGTETAWADFGLPRITGNFQEKVVKKRKTEDVQEPAVKKKKNSNNSRGDEEHVPSLKKKKKFDHDDDQGNVQTLKKKKDKQPPISSEMCPKETDLNDDLSSPTKELKKKKKKNKGKGLEEDVKPNTPQSEHDNRGPANDKGGQFKRRKPYVESSTLHINGVTINISKFDGFDVKTEDATRLKELRSKMLKEGIPRTEVDKAMKLERRKAEKALAREKKKVCFNCRRAGHLLSECPEVGSFGSKSFDSSAVNICYKCGSTEHTHFQCQVKKKKEYSFATCFICKEQGHISSQCPDNPRGLYPQGGSCKICGEVTHLKKDCPQLSQEKADNTVTLDTFASNSKVESLGDDVVAPKQEQTTVVKQRKIIKF